MSDVSQEQMADSFFEDPMGDYVHPDTGKAYSRKEEQAAQPAPAAPTQPAQQPQQTPEAQAPQQMQTQQPAQAAPPAPQDPFSFMVQGADGTEQFDANAALSFLQPVKATAQPLIEPQQPQMPQQPVAPEQPQTSPLEMIQQNLSRPFDYMQQYINMGYDAQTAMTLAKQQVDADVQAHSYQMRLDEMESKFSAREKALNEERETIRLEPKAEQNIFAVAKDLNMSTDQFNQLMFDRRYGGDVILNMFGAMNPDKAQLQGPELEKSLQSWYVRTMANPAMAQTLAELAQARVYKSLMPRIIGHARQTAQNVSSQNAQANMAQPARNDRPGRVQTASKDPLQSYLTERRLPTV